MTRLVLMLLAVLALSAGLSWLADRPGIIVVDWEGHRGELSVFHAVVILSIMTAIAAFAWTLIRQLWSSPATVGQYLMRRKQQRGLDALSSGMIAVGAGDRGGATRYALQARKSLPNEPLTDLLRAQAAQLSGDKATARRIFEAMLSSPDTEQLGLRGLYLEAARMKEWEAARQFAERALRLNQKLAWPVEGLFDLQCKDGNWEGALATLAIARKQGQLDKPTGDRRRAVLLTAQAQNLEDSESDKALSLALEAHGLAPSLVPASAIAGRLLASRGNTSRAAKVLQKTWAKSPHPDLATAYAYARIGDSPRDRLDRIKQLAALTPQSIESPIAVATAAIEARSFSDARLALQPFVDGRLTQRIATLMARIEGEEHGDKGKVREWLARAVNAVRDPAWTADGIVSERWAAVSPVTGALDAFQWRVPLDDLKPAEGDELTTRLESLVALGAAIPGEVSASGAQYSPSVEPDPEHAETSTTGPAKKDRVKSIAIDAEVVDDPPNARASPANALSPLGSTQTAGRPPAEREPDLKETSARQAPKARPFTNATAEIEIREREPEKPATGATGADSAAKTSAPSNASKTASPGRSSGPSEQKGESRSPARASSEPQIFVAPHAPDDPGPEDADDTKDSPSRPNRAP